MFRICVDYSQINGSVPERPKGTGCKPVGVSLRWFDSNPAHYLNVSLSYADNEFFVSRAISSVGRAADS
jgi:hypothetical protein